MIEKAGFCECECWLPSFQVGHSEYLQPGACGLQVGPEFRVFFSSQRNSHGRTRSETHCGSVPRANYFVLFLFLIFFIFKILFKQLKKRCFMWWIHDKYFYYVIQIRVPWVGKMKECKFWKIKFLMTWHTRVTNFKTWVADDLK